MGKRILLIEPSPTLRAILTMYFQREGHQLVLFEDYQAAAQALPRFQAEPPDLVFVALRSDQPDTLRLVTLLRQQNAHMTLVMMVPQEDSSQVTIQRLVQATRSILLPKPFSIRDVLNLVAASGQTSSSLPHDTHSEQEDDHT